MCAINPKHERHFTLSVYTSLNMPETDFVKLVLDAAIAMEMEWNKDARLRWHIGEVEG